MIEVGTKVEGVWGAMFPSSYGKVVAITKSNYIVEWEDDDLPANSYQKDSIRPMSERSSGSPIGVYILEDQSRNQKLVL
tara:strand:+ start:288 stop:524 length:237 start_codon:yes stop_codon:yes gene_type:complete